MSDGFEVSYLLLRAINVRHKTAKIRKDASSMFGNDGKYTQWLKNDVNFSAMPIVPHTSIICMQSRAKLLQHECSSFILFTAG